MGALDRAQIVLFAIRAQRCDGPDGSLGLLVAVDRVEETSETSDPIAVTSILCNQLMLAFSYGGRSLQNMYEVLISLISKTLTSGRLRTLFHLLLTWSVDPDLGVEGGWGRNLVYKAFGVVLIGAFENLGSSFGDRFGVSLMDISWGHECNA